MFRILISLAHFPPINGIRALDWRRAHGFTDGVRVAHDRSNVSAEVSEEFARAWFPPDDEGDRVEIDLDMLTPADIRQEADRVNFADLTPERVQELYIAARFRALRAELAEATAQADDAAQADDDE